LKKLLIMSGVDDSEKVRVGKDGKVYRRSKRQYANQDLYEGGIINELHSQIAYWSLGEFVDGMRHGRGSLVLSRGDRYNGEFERDLFHGYGVYIWKPGYDEFGNYIAGRRYDGVCL
jgi:hypothetical protein